MYTFSAIVVTIIIKNASIYFTSLCLIVKFLNFIHKEDKDVKILSVTNIKISCTYHILQCNVMEFV